MHYRRRRHVKWFYTHSDGENVHIPKRKRYTKQLALLLLFSAALFLASAMSFLKELSSQIAVSDASDIITVQINNAISEIMAEGDYTGDYFVTFVKNENGDISAVSSNMARINALSARILDRIVGVTEGRKITVSIPLGNLTGVSLLMGRGPGVPVQIIVLTSSRVQFNNSVVTAGINQTNHRINLDVIVDIDILIPWDVVSTEVVSEVMIADTVIVGKVPETYLNMQ